jgi:hypothetical protein
MEGLVNRWQQDRQDWIAEGLLLVRMICSACGGNKVIAEIRRAHDDGEMLVRQLPDRRAADEPARAQREPSQRRDPTLSQFVDTLESWDRTFRCRQHGRRTVDAGLLAEALERPQGPATLRS